MDDHGIDLDRFEEDNIARDPGADGRVRRIHETAAVLDDKRLAAESLNVRQCLKERRGLGNQVLHRRKSKTVRGRRSILFDLDLAIQRLSRDHPEHPSAVQLTGVYHNLLRQWAEM